MREYRLLAGQEEVARHLHGDRRGALALAAGDEVGTCGTQHAGEVDAGVLIEAVVLGGQDGVLEDRRDVLDADEGAALFSVLADQGAVGGIDAQRNLGVVVGQGLQ